MYFYQRILRVVQLLLLTSGVVFSDSCDVEGDERVVSAANRNDVIQICFENNGVKSWTFVCFEGWSSSEAYVYCRRAGYILSDYSGLGASNIISDGMVKLINLDCSSDSMSLLDCSHSTTMEDCHYVSAVEFSCRRCSNAETDCNAGICEEGRCVCEEACMNGGFCFLGECICPTGISGVDCSIHDITVGTTSHDTQQLTQPLTTISTTISTQIPTSNQTNVESTMPTTETILSTTETTMPTTETTMPTTETTMPTTETTMPTTETTMPTIETILPTTKTILSTTETTMPTTETIMLTTESILSTTETILPTIDCTSSGLNQGNCSESAVDNNISIIGLVISLVIAISISIILSVLIILVICLTCRKKSTDKLLQEPRTLILDNLEGRDLNTNNPTVTTCDNVAGEEVIYSEVVEIYCDSPINSLRNSSNIYHTISQDPSPYQDPTHFLLEYNNIEHYMSIVGGEVIEPSMYANLLSQKIDPNQLIDSIHFGVSVNSLYKSTIVDSPYLEPPKNFPELKHMVDAYIHEIRAEDIEIGEKFASGQFGVVYRGKYSTGKGDIPVAIKTLKETVGTNKDTKMDFMREAAILTQFHHPYVLRLIGILTTQEPWMMVTELLKTELRQLLLQIRPTASSDKLNIQNLLLKFSQEIAAGMEHLADKKFIHRDLAARNVLVAKDLSVRVADFGMSRGIDCDNDYYTSSGGGRVPLRWTAPEALFYNKFSEKSDVWSFGMTLYEIWSLGDKPWEGCNNEEVIQALTNGDTLSQPVRCPEKMYQIMLETWRQDPKMRPTFRQISKCSLDS
ncbi:hypothetical protein LOD99_431 [Oopsacas minuta]|uniref:Receptor protein-tyrosine kinase n=1 Tax=Oopsacas minuta TaxID=111878 RepID=A0AAV7K9C2_9METZ|nr:hypothetical protein LOD99_431 [Oopsacas minuta]